MHFVGTTSANSFGLQNGGVLPLNSINATVELSSVNTAGTELNANFIEMLLRDKITLDLSINLNCFAILHIFFSLQHNYHVIIEC